MEGIEEALSELLAKLSNETVYGSTLPTVFGFVDNLCKHESTLRAAMLNALTKKV
jgi:hypothetical protein